MCLCFGCSDLVTVPYHNRRQTASRPLPSLPCLLPSLLHTYWTTTHPLPRLSPVPSPLSLTHHVTSPLKFLQFSFFGDDYFFFLHLQYRFHDLFFLFLIWIGWKWKGGLQDLWALGMGMAQLHCIYRPGRASLDVFVNFLTMVLLFVSLTCRHEEWSFILSFWAQPLKSILWICCAIVPVVRHLKLCDHVGLQISDL